MPSLRCRLCGQQDKLHNLIAPCLCAKRDDALLCHAQCLLQLIEHSLQHRVDTNEQEAATCPACRKPYQLKFRWRLQWSGQKALSAFSLDQYCHLLGLGLMLALLLLTAWFTLHPQHSAAKASQQQQDSSSTGTHVWVWLIVLVVVVCAAVAIAQVLVRLRRHQTQVEINPDDMLV